MIAGVLSLDAQEPADLLDRRYQQLADALGVQHQRWDGVAARFGAFAHAPRRSDVRSAPVAIVGALLIAADLRLDGRDALQRQLCLAGEIDDRALIGACWARWGPRCVDHLFGDFAFAVWCAESRRLWLARDPMGHRALYLRRQGQQLAFASALRPLRMLEGPVSADPDWLIDHLLNVPGDPARTAWREIRRIPAGHVCRFDHTGSDDARRYFQLQPPEASAGLSESAWRDGFRERYLAAVRDRLSPSELIAATLSGGLDSSAVAATAVHLLDGGNIRGYAGRFPQTPASDEGAYLAELRALPGLQHRDLDVSAHSPLASYQALLPALDEPVLIQNLHLWSTIYQAAQADGVRIVLDGHDGDSALGRSAGADARLRMGPPPVPSPVTRLLNGLRSMRQQWRPAPIPIALTLIEPDFARAHHACERWQHVEAERRRAVEGDRQQRHTWRLCSGYSAYATERLSRIAAHYGCEPRHPFYDVRLLSWCIGLPQNVLERDGHSRWVLRDALAGILPDTVRWRADKTSLAPQFHRAFVDLDGARVDALIAQINGPLATYVDMPRLRNAWRRYQKNPDNAVSTALWAIMSLGVWLQES